MILRIFVFKFIWQSVWGVAECCAFSRFQKNVPLGGSSGDPAPQKHLLNELGNHALGDGGGVGAEACHRLVKVVFVFVSKAGRPMHLLEYDLLQEVQPDIAGRPELWLLQRKNLISWLPWLKRKVRLPPHSGHFR